MSILRSSARHSSTFRRSLSLREALLDARRGTVTHRTTIDTTGGAENQVFDQTLPCVVKRRQKLLSSNEIAALCKPSSAYEYM